MRACNYITVCAPLWLSHSGAKGVGRKGCLKRVVPSHSDIQHIRINFSNFLYLDPGNVTLEDDSIGILINIQSSYTNLSTLTISLYSINTIELKLNILNNPKIVIEILILINTYFRAILFLQKIIV